MGRLRPVLMLSSVFWFLAEWILAHPPIVRQGFWAWDEAALRQLRQDAAFQLVVLDYALAYAVAFGLSVRDARQRSKHWPLWTAAFLLATAPAMLLYWANRSS